MKILKNNKGLTITEIVISISLVSIVLIFLFNALITIKNTNDNTAKSSKELINQALVTRSIQNDFRIYDLQQVYACDNEEIKQQGTKRIIPNPPSDVDNLYCLKFIYNENLTSDNIGYLLYYTYNYSSEETINVVGYKRGYYQIMRESSITPSSSTKKGEINNHDCKASDNICTLTIKVPIIDADDNDYSIKLNYIYPTLGVRFTDTESPEVQLEKAQIFKSSASTYFGFSITTQTSI